VIEVGRALAAAKIALVPQIMVAGGGADKGGGTLVDVLLANLVQKGMEAPKPAATAGTAPAGAPAADAPKS
jgi:hypothetical protein